MDNFASFISDRKQVASRARKEIAVLRANKADIQKAVALLRAAERSATRTSATVFVSAYASAYVNTYDSTVELNASISERCATQLNSAAAKRIMGTLLLAGVEFGETKKEANEWDAGTTTEGKLKIGAVTCNFTVRTRLASEGATCEKVQVGVKTETIETPIFEIRCNG